MNQCAFYVLGYVAVAFNLFAWVCTVLGVLEADCPLDTPSRVVFPIFVTCSLVWAVMVVAAVRFD
ncbi:MAG: hypothetical protein KIT11_05555 [Fimbriimonadaceae bacterium]|nr:hypothetical protein [Fimbriimonadaceae bacterium]QYK56641.1 MAG: hypothetical protein KF733_03965 [Fimbriimonadaceae bacterium]